MKQIRCRWRKANQIIDIYYLLPDGSEQRICDAEQTQHAAWRNDMIPGRWICFNCMMADIINYLREQAQ
jgi:hypothetical protein